jgi:ribosomal protein S21
VKIEEIYRKINEIYRSLDNYHNQLNANKEKFEKIYNEHISSTTHIGTIILSLYGIAASVSGYSLAAKVLNNNSVAFLIFLGLGGLGGFIVLYIIKKRQKKKLLDILKEFHDGFTTISFMKAFLDRIPPRVKNLEKKQLEELEEKQKKYLKALENYYIMVRGGIVFRIRKKIVKSTTIKEEYVYGYNEGDLYKMLIYNASQRYKAQKENEEEKDLIETLFKAEKDDLHKDNLNILKRILNEYNDELEDKSLITDASVSSDEKDIGKIVQIDGDNCKAFIIVEGHDIPKSFRENNVMNVLRNLKNSISKRKRIKEWHLTHRYKIPLEPEKIKDWDWEYGKPVKLEDIIPKE